MAFLRALLLAFVGTLAWFISAAAHQTSGSCFSGSHYVPSAAVALAVVVAVDVITEAFIQSSDRRASGRRPPLHLIAGGAITTAILMAAGLLIAGYLAAVVSCSA